MSHCAAIIARFTPATGKRGALRNLLDHMVVPSRAEAGCLGYDLYESPESGQFVLLERYRDPGALHEHRSSRHYASYRAQLDDLLGEPISVTELVALDDALDRTDVRSE